MTEEDPNHPTDELVVTDRDLLISLLDAVVALSERLFPEERMEVEIRGRHNGEQAFAYISGTTLTHWVKR